MQTYRNQIPTKPGLESIYPTLAGMLVNSGSIYDQSAANWETSAAKDLCVRQGGFHQYASGLFTVTNDGSGTFAQASGATARGITWTDAAPADGEDASLNTLKTVTVALNKPYTAWAEVYLSDCDDMGLSFGFVTSTSVDPITTDPADSVFFRKAKNAATLVGRVRANSGTAADSGTLLTVADATWYRLGIQFYFGNGSPTDYTTAATVAGSYCNFIVGTLNTTTGDWTYTTTAATSTQMTALIAIFNTTPAVFTGHIGTLANGTTSRTMYIGALNFEVNR